jgi:MarR family transcriptional regulator, organic hydroperoxide resistance regulator
LLGSTTHRLNALHRAHVAALGPRLAELGLHPGAELLLAEVAGHEGIALGELAQRLAVKPPSVTKVVGRLERAGLVTRLADPEDGRVQRVELTAAGRKLMPAIRRAWSEAGREALARLSVKERETLDAVLARALGE